jgi:D-alanyl-D-alanine carboxypeptidase (penicillin-binding protein 5/6)
MGLGQKAGSDRRRQIVNSRWATLWRRSRGPNRATPPHGGARRGIGRLAGQGAALLLTVVWLTALGAPPVAAAPVQSPLPPPTVTAKAAILVDANSGDVLWAKNPDEALPIASVTKLMTLYIALKAIHQGKASMDDWVPVSDEAYRTSGSQIWLEPGERLTMRQMLTAMAVGSANDAAVAVAEFLAGSTDQFVRVMNEEAQRLGMTHTHFANPHGLPAVEHYSTARDLARLAEAAIRMPGLLDLTRQWEDRTIRNGKGGTLWLVNQNRLLRTFPGTDGLKTGYTREAGFCLVATARRGPTRMIAVVLGAPTSRDRFDDAAALMSWGFMNFRTVPIVARGDLLGRVRVIRGIRREVAAVAGQSLNLTLPRRGGDRVTQQLELAAQVGAPVVRGARLGTLTVRVGDRVAASVPVVAGETVRAVGLPELVWRYFWRILA